MGRNFQKNSNSDLLVWYATQNSLDSLACQEEFYSACPQIIGKEIRVIGLLESQEILNNPSLPSILKARLCIFLDDSAWAKKIVNSVNETPQKNIPNPQNFHFKIYENKHYPRFSIEMRPLSGIWSPFVCAYPFSEDLIVQLSYGEKEKPRTGGVLHGVKEGTTEYGFKFIICDDKATPTMSYYLHCHRLPKEIIFGQDSGKQFEVNPTQYYSIGLSEYAG